ncbi:hypothetical protein PYW08_004685 [Mythimna loreyi]|uniref:Uncharacterized protein n=1 Tax=Mythimna loreyi TaxID=667449 RepID=A0ACC2QTR0_9NEOP|nr:hypothetical protein PYW08_004685 [Mythimna loreyi]
MKLCVILSTVALLASLCAAEPADSSAPRQPSGVLRFKRATTEGGACPTGFIRIDTTCMPEDSVPGQPSGGQPSEVQRFKRSGIIPGLCPPGYINKRGFCIPEDVGDYE